MSCFIGVSSVESLLSAFIVQKFIALCCGSVLWQKREVTDGHDRLVMAGHQTHEPPQSWVKYHSLLLSPVWLLRHKETRLSRSHDQHQLPQGK